MQMSPRERFVECQSNIFTGTFLPDGKNNGTEGSDGQIN